MKTPIVGPANTFCFSEASLRLLRENGEPAALPEQSVLFREGERPTGLFFVLAGRVQETLLSEDGREITLSLYYPGDLFGKFDPFDGAPHDTSARTTEPTSLLWIRQEKLDGLLACFGDLAVEFARWSGYMNRLMRAKYRDAILYGKTGALCSALIRLANMHGPDHIRITNAELADMIGAARESVNRMLADLKKAGAVSVRHGMVAVRDLSYLRSICRCADCPVEVCRP